MKNGFKMIFSKKRKTLQVVKRCPMFVLTYLQGSSMRLRDGSIFSYCHQVDPTKSRLEHSNYSFLFSIIPILVSFQCHRLQSLEIASNTILSGKAKVMIAGGFDHISEEDFYKFANMKARLSDKQR